MDKQILREIGLTEGEIKVYLALLKIGQAKKTELAKESGVSSSKIYEICGRLQKKGIVGTIIKDKKTIHNKGIFSFIIFWLYNLLLIRFFSIFGFVFVKKGTVTKDTFK